MLDLKPTIIALEIDNGKLENRATEQHSVTVNGLAQASCVLAKCNKFSKKIIEMLWVTCLTLPCTFLNITGQL